MKSSATVRALALAAAAAALASPAAAAAQALLHAQTVYQDEQGVALKHPDGVACRDAVAVVSDSGNKRLVFFGVKGGGLVGGKEVKPAQVASPGRLQIDSRGRVLVLDQKHRRIFRLDAEGGYVGAVEPKGAGDARVVVDGFKLAPDDVLFLLDGAGKRVLVLDADDAVTRQVPLPPGVVFTDLAVEQGGRMFAVDAVAATVWLAEAGADRFQPLSKPLKEYMNFPVYLTRKDTTLLLVDQYGHGIVNVTLDGTYRGRQSTMGWADGQLYYPSQLCVAADGEVVVADRNNNRVQVFTVAR